MSYILRFTTALALLLAPAFLLGAPLFSDSSFQCKKVFSTPGERMTLLADEYKDLLERGRPFEHQLHLEVDYAIETLTYMQSQLLLVNSTAKSILKVFNLRVRINRTLNTIKKYSFVPEEDVLGIVSQYLVVKKALDIEDTPGAFWFDQNGDHKGFPNGLEKIVVTKDRLSIDEWLPIVPLPIFVFELSQDEKKSPEIIRNQLKLYDFLAKNYGQLHAGKVTTSDFRRYYKARVAVNESFKSFALTIRNERERTLLTAFWIMIYRDGFHPTGNLELSAQSLKEFLDPFQASPGRGVFQRPDYHKLLASVFKASRYAASYSPPDVSEAEVEKVLVNLRAFLKILNKDKATANSAEHAFEKK